MSNRLSTYQITNSPTEHPLVDTTIGVDSILVKIDPLLFALTRSIASYELASWECDEIVQSVRIKLFQALPGKEIDNFGSYLRQTVHNEYVSFLRHRKSLLPLPTNDDGEPYQGRVLISLSEGMRDPSMEVEHEMAVHELLDNLVDAILELPVMQKLAMVCFLLERIDDPALLIAAFKKRHLDIEHFRWPEDKDARQRLKASYYSARTKIAQHLDIDLATYKGLRKARYNYSSRSIQGSTLGERVTTEQTTSPPTEYEVREIAMNKETSGEVGNPTSITVEIATLAEPYRTAVYLHCVEGLSYSKIGIRLGLRVGTVKSHVSRGMCLLREASKSESDKDSREKQDNPEHETLNSAPSLAAQIEALPEPYRTTLRLHKLEGLSYPAIAAQLDIPVGTVKSHVSRGMRLLGSSVAEVVVMG